jgi:integrase
MCATLQVGFLISSEKDRGLFLRGDNWWIRWTCPYGHEHREKVGPKGAARELYQRRKVAVKAESFCLTEAVARQRQEQDTDPLPEANEHPRPLSHEEEERLFAVLPEHYKPIITLALHTGLRLGELRAQEWRDVDLASGTLLVTRPKSKKRESIPLNAVAFAILAALEQEEPLLFPTMPKKMSDLFIKYVRKAGIEGATFHCLRDTYISRLAQTCNTPTLMALARHRDYKTTQRYVRIDGAHLKQAVEQLVPSPENNSLTGTTTGTNVSRLL